MDDRRTMNAIFYVLRTGCQWKALPCSLGRKSTVHDRFQEWRKAGLFEAMWRRSLLDYDEMKDIDWEWQSMDTTMTKAPLGGEKAQGPTPPIERSQERRGAFWSMGTACPSGSLWRERTDMTSSSRRRRSRACQ
jgi:putative transposase